MSDPRVVIVDNYDSFTYNLVQLVGELTGVRAHVVTHDVPIDEIGLDEATHVILSPGPGHPARPEDFGVCEQVIERVRVPLLGVCLGHQGIVRSFGGKVVAAERVMHGYRSAVEHSGSGLFDSVPQGALVVRYHSLRALEPLPDQLRVTARSDDGVVMAVEHVSRPIYGIQFHPESVLTEAGSIVLANFLGLPGGMESRAVSSAPRRRPSRRRRVEWRKLDREVDSLALYSRLVPGRAGRFWLDSAMTVPSSPKSAPARFSFFGACEHEVSCAAEDALPALQRIADQLDVHVETDLPFEFVGGYVGFLGYELGAAFGHRRLAESEHADLRLMRCDRLIAIDHLDKKTYAVASGADSDADREWLERTMDLIEGLPAPAGHPQTASGSPPPVQLHRSIEQYLSDIERCLEAIRAGDSYELCLTNQCETSTTDGALDLYRRLRRHNPAPYAALLELEGLSVLSSSPELFLHLDRDGDVVSKPIKGTRARRGSEADDAEARRELGDSPKDRAENLMITDLLRNDLGRVCQLGSVRCDPLMDLESFATVHQMVTTVRGRLRAEDGLVQLLAATFPGGSMTGAPKRRAMEILATLEGRPRGVYSGAIGYLGHGGVAALSIAIRTAVLRGGRVTVGAGGAIVAGSEPLAEVEEMRCKAEAVLGALG